MYFIPKERTDMSYILLVVAGLLAITLVKKDWEAGKQILFIIIFIAAGAVIYSVLLVFYPGHDDGIIIKGDISILSRIPFHDIGLYFIMLLGMASKYLYDAIGDKKRKKITFNKWQFIKPFLVSPIIFISVYSLISKTTPDLLIFVFSYQNGFFWQTLLYNAAKENKI